ncbi:MAG: epoxyqueuosine reductase QueH [Patescibacteria group bacterium]|nr:epoxyqueuosine reductase QueH [Patescibacteria group bacterium]
MNKLVKFYLVLCWAWLIFLSLTMPFPVNNEPQEITFLDKGVHFILFGVLVWLIIWAGLEFKRLNFKILALASFIISFIYAVFCEYIQIFVPGRDLSEFDLAAGILGMILAIIIYFRFFYKSKPRVLLHICCAGCGAYVAQVLKKDYDVVLYFYNPNIYPESEYGKRLAEAKKIAAEFGLKLISEKYDHLVWLKKIKGFEREPERGGRCWICYQERLEKTAKTARDRGFAFFTTTLTISPHKDAKAISELGQEMEKKYKINFLDRDFKKQDGFKKSACLCKELGLYRQNYCGCEFSRNTKVTNGHEKYENNEKNTKTQKQRKDCFSSGFNDIIN